MSAGLESNPFSTRWTRPGAVPYLFPPGVSVQCLAADFAASGSRGQIIGPHGSGKSTLLAALVPALQESGRRVELISLHDGQRRLPIDLASLPEPEAARVIVVDGYEQLSRWSRFRLRWRCARRGWGLLVSAHADAGFPELFRTEVSDDLARQIVTQLQAAGASILVSDEDVRAALAGHSGNMREALFALYDLYELRRRSPVSPTSQPSSQL